MNQPASGNRRGFLRFLAGSPLIARAWAQQAPSEQISSALKSAKDALEDWVLKEKRSWNESYALHAFLQYNSAFEIVYWNNFVWHRLRDDLAGLMPLCLENEGGSIWLRRVR